MADCLREFLPAAFRTLHDDGQVTVLSTLPEVPALGGSVPTEAA